MNTQFELGEDIRNQRKLIQDAKWKGAISDGRAHYSHRYSNLILIYIIVTHIQIVLEGVLGYHQFEAPGIHV